MPKETRTFRNPPFVGSNESELTGITITHKVKALFQLLIDAEQTAPKVCVIRHLITVHLVVRVKYSRAKMGYLCCTISGTQLERLESGIYSMNGVGICALTKHTCYVMCFWELFCVFVDALETVSLGVSYLTTHQHPFTRKGNNSCTSSIFFFQLLCLRLLAFSPIHSLARYQAPRCSF